MRLLKYTGRLKMDLLSRLLSQSAPQTHLFLPVTYASVRKAVITLMVGTYTCCGAVSWCCRMRPVGVGS
ncbi:hypothetical protein PCI56_01660 [Plesiomonas shigelloides subsp. oncorhynchi]|nr:hypothetical protein [Plesiomonas shigelloides]